MAAMLVQNDSSMHANVILCLYVSWSWHFHLQCLSLLNLSSRLLCVAGPLSARGYLRRLLILLAEKIFRTAENAAEGYAEKLCFNKGCEKGKVIVIALPSNRKASHPILI